MYIVVGLGNPGISYRNTRHNMGFMTVDVIAERLGVKLTRRGFSSHYEELRYKDERLILVKPQTYMNLSGDAVQQIVHYYKLPMDRLVVIYDDIDLPCGELRIRANGSSGTHNGMRSVTACVQSEGFPRVRIGIGRDPTMELMDYVTKRPSGDERKLLESAIADAADAALLIVEGKIADAQGKYNHKH